MKYKLVTLWFSGNVCYGGHFCVSSSQPTVHLSYVAKNSDF